MTESKGGELAGTRQQAIDALCEHFANDALSVDEFERRVDLAHKAQSSADLRKLLQDLPTGDLPIRRDEVTPAHPPRAEASVPAHRVKERGVMVAALGGVERKGRWIPARQTYAVAVMGRDSRGGTTPLEQGVRWTLFPKKKVISLSPDGVIRALGPGKVEMRAAFGRMQLKPRSLTVVAPPPAPGPLEIAPHRTTAAIRAAFPVEAGHYLLVFRREEGQPVPETPIRKTPAACCTDWGLQPGGRYLYAASVVDAKGIPVTQRTPEVRILSRRFHLRFPFSQECSHGRNVQARAPPLPRV